MESVSGIQTRRWAGYAFTALFTMDGLSLQNLVETEVLRGLLTPVGHGLWTAILGGMLFRTGWLVHPLGTRRSGSARWSVISWSHHKGFTAREATPWTISKAP
jgi:hypothetical protein